MQTNLDLYIVLFAKSNNSLEFQRVDFKKLKLYIKKTYVSHIPNRWLYIDTHKNLDKTPLWWSRVPSHCMQSEYKGRTAHRELCGVCVWVIIAHHLNKEMKQTGGGGEMMGFSALNRLGRAPQLLINDYLNNWLQKLLGSISKSLRQ